VTAEQRPADLGLTLPEPPRPGAAFEPFVRLGVEIEAVAALVPGGPR
jgi:hypothetical protein